MFRNIYRALVISRTKSAAIQVANQLSHRQLSDIGCSRCDIINSSVESVRKEFDQADLKRANNAASRGTGSNILEVISNTLLRPLSSTRSYD
jgi:uncharacterized protein YjiS (DUF1127 family)